MIYKTPLKLVAGRKLTSPSSRRLAQLSPTINSPRGSRRNNGVIHDSWYTVLRLKRVILVFVVIYIVYLLKLNSDDYQFVTVIDKSLAIQKPQAHEDHLDEGNTTRIKEQTTTKEMERSFLRPHTSIHNATSSVLTNEQDKPERVQVNFLSSSDFQSSKFILDGLERSKYTEILGITILNHMESKITHLNAKIRDTKKPLIWLVDWGSLNRDCHSLSKLLFLTSEPPTMDDFIILTDFSSSTRWKTCSFLDSFSNVKHTKRSIVEDRYFDPNNWIHPGNVMSIKTMGIQHTPLVLRESFVEAIPGHSKRRFLDIVCLYQADDKYSLLREQVAKDIYRHHHSKRKVVVGSKPADLKKYARLLSYAKIVVLAQHDEWEDQYLLYEALASKALVFSDSMLVKPDGLSNNTNIVIYDNLDHLHTLLTYFLGHEKERSSIAKRGHELVMGRHRSWHRIEQVFFGRSYTGWNEPYEPAPKPKKIPEIDVFEYRYEGERIQAF